MRPYRIILIVLAFVVVNALGLSFITVNKGSYKNSLYHRFTKQRFAWTVSDPKPKQTIQAGWANVTIAPTGEASADGVKWDSIQTRALVLDNGTTRAAMITVGLGLMPPTVAQALEQKLSKIGFAWKNVYFGASYAQPNLGGWTDNYMGKRQVGPFDQQRVNQLTEAILKAVQLAQTNMAAVQMGYTQTDLRGQEQRTTHRDQAERLHLLQLRKPTGESALIYTGNVGSLPTGKTTKATPQAEFLHPLTLQLEKQTKAFVFAMVGSFQAPTRSNAQKGLTPTALAAQLASLLSHQTLHSDSTLIAQTTPLIQNDPQIRVSQNWRLKPWLAKALYGDYPAELKALRVGQTVFVGCPGEVSSELAQELLSLPVAEQRQLIITSNNGGNLGQLVPDKYYFASNNPYPISQINRFGPHTGEFFADMTQSLVTSLK